jgi:repressor LexA
MTQEEKFKKIVRFVMEYTKQNGYPPNMREIGPEIGLSSSATIHKVVKQCLRQGYIEMNPRIARSIRVSPEGKKLAK